MVSWFTRLFALFLLVSPAKALEAPQYEVILMVAGKIAVTNGPGVASFDSDMIERLPQHEFTTRTPWYPEPRSFRGPLLRDLLGLLKVEGSELYVTALNEYVSHIPISDAQQYDVILARSIDGQLLRVRDRGPLFIIYPFDLQTNLKADTYYNRSVWQVKSIHVE